MSMPRRSTRLGTARSANENVEVLKKNQDATNGLLREILSLRVPRCCVCVLDYVDEKGGYENLIQMPYCQCRTTLMKVNRVREQAGVDRSLLKKAKTAQEKISDLLITNFCADVNSTKIRKKKNKIEILKEYRREIMCRKCFDNFLLAGDDVIEHDYRSKTQPNQKFSVGKRCPICRKQFRNRELGDIAGRRGKRRSQEENIEWTESVKNTIHFIKFAKELKRTILHNRWRNRQNEIDVVKEWIDEEESHSSDECFSFSDDDGDAEIRTRQKKKSCIIAPADGEIKNDLIQKDPKFRQECEDREFIQKLMETKEGRIELGLEPDPIKSDQEREDELLARQLLDEEEKKIQPPKTSSPKKPSTPLLQYLEKAGSENYTSPKSQSREKISIITKPKKQQKTINGIKRYMDRLAEYSDLCDSDSDCSVKIIPSSGNVTPDDSQKDNLPKQDTKKRNCPDALQEEDIIESHKSPDPVLKKTVKGIQKRSKFKSPRKKANRSIATETTNGANGKKISQYLKKQEQPQSIILLDSNSDDDKLVCDAKSKENCEKDTKMKPSEMNSGAKKETSPREVASNEHINLLHTILSGRNYDDIKRALEGTGDNPVAAMNLLLNEA